MNIELKFSKTKDVKTPIISTSGSIGVDFFLPNENYLYYKTCKKCDFKKAKNDEIKVKKFDNILIPLGIHVNIPNGYYIEFKNKSGIAFGKGLIKGAELIDTDYQGELMLNIINIGDNTITLKSGDKIIQGVVKKKIDVSIKEIKDISNLYKKETERGSGGFGSTGLK